jgi:beta-galactosidase
VWREVVALGADLGRLAGIRGTRVVAEVAMLWDWQSWWAQKLEWRPSVDLDARERAEAYYQALYDRHLTVDFAHPEADLTRYPLVVAPALYLLTEAGAANLRRYVEGGGTLLVSYFSGIVDGNDAVHSGPHPGPLRDVLGLTVQEWLPLRRDERVPLDGGATGDVWAEAITPAGAEVIAAYTGGPAAGGPAILRNRLGGGHAWYVSTRLGPADLDPVLARACADAGLAARDELPRDVELVRRVGAGAEYLFAINHTDHDVKIAVDAAGGEELITGESTGGSVAVPAGTVRVVRLAG